MNHSIDRIAQLGNLHDSIVNRIEYNVQVGDVIVSLGDIYANFSGDSEYPGEMKGTLTFNRVESIDMKIPFRQFDEGGFSEPLTIYDVTIARHGRDIVVKINVSPEGAVSIRCREIEISETHSSLWKSAPG